jgi:hypothetical protein
LQRGVIGRNLGRFRERAQSFLLVPELVLGARELNPPREHGRRERGRAACRGRALFLLAHFLRAST